MMHLTIHFLEWRVHNFEWLQDYSCPVLANAPIPIYRLSSSSKIHSVNSIGRAYLIGTGQFVRVQFVWELAFIVIQKFA